MTQGWLSLAQEPFYGCFMENQAVLTRSAREIRVRTGQSVCALGDFGQQVLCKAGAALVPTQAQVQALLLAYCEQAMYAHEEELMHGFLTLPGGHRVGVCGNVVLERGKAQRLVQVQGMNIRIAREIPCAPKALHAVLEGKTLHNTLVVSAPGLGKTTLLRALARHISGQGFQVAIADERSEIAACVQGVPQHDIGPCTDVLDRVPKVQAIAQLVRAMGPQVIVTDEIGGEGDLCALRAAAAAGVQVLASAHAKDMQALRAQGDLARCGLFARFILLMGAPGKIHAIYDKDGRPL